MILKRRTQRISAAGVRPCFETGRICGRSCEAGSCSLERHRTRRRIFRGLVAIFGWPVLLSIFGFQRLAAMIGVSKSDNGRRGGRGGQC